MPSLIVTVDDRGFVFAAPVAIEDEDPREFDDRETRDITNTAVTVLAALNSCGVPACQMFVLDTKARV